jgi:hypothetical protein
MQQVNRLLTGPLGCQLDEYATQGCALRAGGRSQEWERGSISQLRQFLGRLDSVFNGPVGIHQQRAILKQGSQSLGLLGLGNTRRFRRDQTFLQCLKGDRLNFWSVLGPGRPTQHVHQQSSGDSHAGPLSRIPYYLNASLKRKKAPKSAPSHH